MLNLLFFEATAWLGLRPWLELCSLLRFACGITLPLCFGGMVGGFSTALTAFTNSDSFSDFEYIDLESTSVSSESGWKEFEWLAFDSDSSTFSGVIAKDLFFPSCGALISFGGVVWWSCLLLSSTSPIVIFWIVSCLGLVSLNFALLLVSIQALEVLKQYEAYHNLSFHLIVH